MANGELDKTLAAGSDPQQAEGDRPPACRRDVVVLPTELLDRMEGVPALNQVLADAGLGEPLDDAATIDRGRAMTALRLKEGVLHEGIDAPTLCKNIRQSREKFRQSRARARGEGRAIVDAAEQLAPDRSYATGDPVAPAKVGFGTKQGHGDAGLVPVTLFAPAPRWRGLLRRRPVVALLDTAVDDNHHWLNTSAHDPFCVDAASLGWPASALRQENDTYAGHGTFTAGLLRQVAPDVRVLSVPVMQDDGCVDGWRFEHALEWLQEGLAEGTGARRVDAVCIPFGYQPTQGDEDDEKHNGRVRDLLRSIALHGVRIVASAGNGGSDRATYPAAFAAEADVPVISVGALNPDGKPAHYSNHGDWVTDWEIGTGVISTMPRALNGGLERPDPPNGFPHGHTLDPDDFAGGFGRWSGTSFAAAVMAGRLAQDMVDTQPAGEP